MVPEFQKPRVTEIHVRMDCNGCVQKIKKALNGINDQEKIVKAIKKTRKMATICNIEPTESPSQPAEPSPQQTEPEPEPEENAQALKATQPQQAEVPPAQEGSPEKPPKETPQPEQPPHEATPSPTPAENNARQQSQNTPVTKDVGEVHVVHHHPPNNGNRFGSGHSYVGHWDRYHNSPVLLQEPPQPVYVTHSYNTYRPSPYVTEYEYVRSPPRHTHYNRMEHYSADYHNSNGNITSMLSDENPNACRIV